MDQHSRNEVSCTLATTEWCSLYWDALQLLKKSGIFISSESVRALIRTYSYMGLAEEAIQCFDRMSEFDCEPDAHAYNTILKVVLKKDLFVLAFSLYNVMLRSNSLPDDHTYTLLIGGFCKIGNLHAALEMLDDMSKRGVLSDVKTYTAIIYGLCQWKKFDEAFRTDEALSLLSLLRIDGFALNLQSYCSLINSFIHAKRYREAYVWYTKMFKMGIVPDVTLYAIMIRGLSEEGRVGEAAKMLDEMIGMGLVPDAYCYNALIKGFCDIGRLDQARSLQLEVSKDEQFHNAYTYTILICCMCRNGMVGEARKIFNQMEKLGCLPSVVTFSALMHGLCKAHRIEEARLLLHEMEIGRSPSLFFRLSQGSDRVFDNAKYLIELSKRAPLDGVAQFIYKKVPTHYDIFTITPQATTSGFSLCGLYMDKTRSGEDLSHEEDKVLFWDNVSFEGDNDGEEDYEFDDTDEYAVDERLLGATLGVVLTGAVVLEQRRNIYSSISNVQSQSQVSPVALFPKRHKIAPRCHHHHPDPSMLLWKRVHFHNASGLLTRFLPRRSHHHSSADADAVVVTRDLPNCNRRLPLRFCVWVALKFEILVDQHSRNEVSCTLATKEWCSIYWDALQLLKKSGIFISSESVRALIRTYSYMGLAEEAIKCFDRMSEFDCEPDAHAYNTILKVVLKKDLFVLAFSLYNVMLRSNSLPDDHTYTLLIGGFCKIGNFNAALEMLDDMSKRGVLPDVKTYTAIIYGLCQWKKVDEAFRLFNTMKENGCLPTLRCYNVLIDGFCKNGRTDEALSLLSLLRIDGFALNLQSYCYLINSFIHAKRYSEAYVWYTKMFKRGIVPDVTLYAIMIRGLSEEGRVGEAAKMLDEMIGMGLVPDAYCYNALIKGFCDIGRLDQARSLQLEVSKDEQFHNAYTYTILICGMCRNGMVGEAREIFNQMEKLGCLPSVVTFSALMHGLCKARRIEEAHLLLHEMEIGRSPSLFFRLSQGSDRVLDSVSLQKKVEQMCEAGEVLNAYKLLKQLAGSGVVPNIITYNILINGFCKTGNINAAIKLFKELQLKGISPDSITYGTLVDGLYRANREDDAFKIREHMLKHGCQPGLSNSNAHMSWLNKKGKVSMAFNIYFEYLKSLLKWDNDSINMLENHFIRGNVKEVIRGLLEMDFKCRDFNLAPYTILITGFCMAKKVDEALAIFSVLGEFNININPTSCVHLIDILCEEGKLDDAVNIFLYTLEKSFMLRPRICNKLLKCLLLSIDKKDYAIDLVDRMQSHGYCLNSHQYDKAMYVIRRLRRRRSNKMHYFK
ncbi:hypothetical protein AAHE18_13G032600 [Arachis hypogaea]